MPKDLLKVLGYSFVFSISLLVRSKQVWQGELGKLPALPCQPSQNTWLSPHPTQHASRVLQKPCTPSRSPAFHCNTQKAQLCDT